VALAGALADPRDKARLADPGLADDLHDGALALGEPVDEAFETLELAVAPDEPSG
jgi:hypothetical protein